MLLQLQIFNYTHIWMITLPLLKTVKRVTEIVMSSPIVNEGEWL